MKLKLKSYLIWLVYNVASYCSYYRALGLLLALLLALKLVGLDQTKEKLLPTTLIQLENNRTAIESLKVRTSYGGLRYIRVSENTWLRETEGVAISYQVPIDRMNELLRFVSQPYVAILVENSPSSLAKYGLTSEQTVELSVLTAKTEISILLGSYAPNGKDIFVLHQEAVYRVPMMAFYTMGAINGL